MTAESGRVCWQCGAPGRAGTTCTTCGTDLKYGSQLLTPAEFTGLGKYLISGTVKWFSDEKGFGFITTDDGTDVFVHHTYIEGDGYRSLAEGGRVQFAIERRKNGPIASGVRARPVEQSEDSPNAAQVQQHVLLIDDNGEVRFLPCISGPTGHVIVDGSQLQSVLADAAVPAAMSRRVRLWKLCSEFERMLNASASESAIQAFFERNPDFLLGDAYEALYPQVVLPMGIGGTTLRPDFILKPFAGVSYEPAVVELKLPSQPLIKQRSGHASLYAHVHDAVSQLRAYAEIFEQPEVREQFHERIGFAPYRPKLALIIGRSQNLPSQRIAAMARQSIQPVELQTYDDVLVRFRQRLGM